MAAKGKKITLFLMDGSANGRIMCELSNWSGKSYKIPRTLLKDSSSREDLSNTGVYILFGKDDSGQNLAYIGEAENIRQRLSQHLKSLEWWNETIVFISKDNNLNKAHIKYLENRLYEIALNANRYILLNKNTPTKSNIGEADISEMEEFIDNLKLLVNTLGHKIFEPIADVVELSKEERIYQIDRKNILAKGKLSNEGFVVFSGATIASKLGAVNTSVAKLREKLISNGTIIVETDKVVLTKDCIFSSSSSAATIVLGVSANGKKEWKYNGKSLGEYEK